MFFYKKMQCVAKERSLRSRFDIRGVSVCGVFSFARFSFIRLVSRNFLAERGIFSVTIES